MRIELATKTLNLTAGSSGPVDVDVFNTGDTIDGVTGRILGLDNASVTSTPPQLALFPDTSGRLQLEVTLPQDFPAGSHTVTVEIASSVDPANSAAAEMELVVAPATKANLMLLPASLTGKRKGRFTLMCENTGNTPVSLTFTATDPERALRYEFERPTLDVAPGQSATAGLLVQGRRPIFGGEATRPITVLGENVDVQLEAHATFTQRPEFSRGLLTALALAAIVALWAGALLFGLSRVLAGDKLA